MIPKCSSGDLTYRLPLFSVEPKNPASDPLQAGQPNEEQAVGSRKKSIPFLEVPSPEVLEGTQTQTLSFFFEGDELEPKGLEAGAAALQQGSLKNYLSPLKTRYYLKNVLGFSVSKSF